MFPVKAAISPCLRSWRSTRSPSLTWPQNALAARYGVFVYLFLFLLIYTIAWPRSWMTACLHKYLLRAIHLGTASLLWFIIHTIFHTVAASLPPSGVYCWSGQCRWWGQPVCVEVWGRISVAQQDPRLWVRSKLYYILVIFVYSAEFSKSKALLHWNTPSLTSNTSSTLTFISIYQPPPYIIVLILCSFPLSSLSSFPLLDLI